MGVYFRPAHDSRMLAATAANTAALLAEQRRTNELLEELLEEQRKISAATDYSARVASLGVSTAPSS